MTYVALLLGAGFGGGIYLVVSGLRRTDATAAIRTGSPRVNGLRRRVGLAIGTGALLGVVTRWPVAAAGGVLLGALLPDLFAGQGDRAAAMARGEAIATWAEMLRDTLSGAHGLEEVIVTTAPIAPAPIRDEILLLAARLPQQRLPLALRRLADDLADPTADLVVAALILAAQGSPRELGELLGTLAIAARDEASMRRRVEATRARARSTVQIVSGTTVAMVVGLLLLNRNYLTPYDDELGQLVLSLVAALFGVGLWWLARMARFEAPARFLSFDNQPEETVE